MPSFYQYVTSGIPPHSLTSMQEVESFYKDKNVLVTGGAGFIGSHLVAKLVRLGAQVTVLDDLSSTGNWHQNLGAVFKEISCIQGSITSLDTCMKACFDQDIIFHLAAFVSVPLSMENPSLCHEINIKGTYNLLEAARQCHVPRFVFSSSSAVYGETHGPSSEEMVCHPASPYGSSKLIGELLCQEYAQNFCLKTICLRYFNVFGKGQNPRSAYAAAIAKFTEQMQNNQPITVFGDGLQSRDFVPVEVVVEANLKVGSLREEKTAMNGQPINIASGKSITILELISLLKKDYPEYSQEVLFGLGRPGDVKHTAASCSRYWNLHNKNM